jgi:hypothetical protein
MGETSTQDSDLSVEGSQRRNALRMFGILVAGITVASFGGLVFWDSHNKNSVNSSSSLNLNNQNVSSSSRITTFITDNQGPSLITIKVVYFGMSTQTTGAKQDYITLKSPAFLADAISEVTQLHPDLIPMIGAMQILIDGNPAEPNQQLSNKDELDFIPIQAGG